MTIKAEYMALIDDCPECKATATQALNGFDYSHALAMLEQRTDLTEDQRKQAQEHIDKANAESKLQVRSAINEYKGGQL